LKLESAPLYPVGEEAQKEATDLIDPTFSNITKRNIQKRLNGQIIHFYERDKLFLFASPRAKREAIDCLEESINDEHWLPDSELMRKIVSIPFPVILNLNPDKYVFEAFLKYYHRPQFDYFTSKHKTGNYGIVEEPDGYDHPVVYNLCGSVLDALDSVVLDHYDLFGLLKSMLNDTGVSEKLTQKLQVADRYILLGFELDRWYFQLFLHYLNRLDKDSFNNFNQNYPILSQVSADSREFVMRQFNIEHFASSREDFDKLYDACVDLKIVRKLHNLESPIAGQIRSLTEQNRFEEAFNLFEQYCPNNTLLAIDLPLLRSRYATLLEHKRLNLEDQRDLQRELNRIRYGLLTFANEIIPVDNE